MNQRDAKRMGRERGHNIASWVDIPEMGSTVWTGADGRVTVDADNLWDIMESLTYDLESDDRDFTPFEFTASAFNRAPNSEALWDAYNTGIALGISDNLAKRRKQWEGK